MKITYTLLVLALAGLVSCTNKDNEEAEKLGGTWKLDKVTWAGKGSFAAGSRTDSLGTFTFTPCKSSKETCDGEVTGYMGTGTEKFGWYIREDGTTFTYATDNTAVPAAEFGGEWTIDELTGSKFTISSETCGSCASLGKETLSFTKQ